MKKLTVIFLLFIMIMPIMLFSKEAVKKTTSVKSMWMTDLDQAKVVAKAHKLPILINFTGSDWCIWCKRLDNEVFSQKAFKDYAQKNFVLVKIDFPREIVQTDAMKKKNEALAKQYNVKGFPTILITDAFGNVINQTGYQEGGPVKYVSHLKELLKNPAK